jgi:Uncharacterized proteins, homologs of microcin C7 resistance protein MccF
MRTSFKITVIVLVVLAIFSLTSFAKTTPMISNTAALHLQQPSYLNVGDTVAIVAPSGILKHREGEIQQAVALLKQWGLHAVVGKHVFNKANHFAGQMKSDVKTCKTLWMILQLVPFGARAVVTAQYVFWIN